MAFVFQFPDVGEGIHEGRIVEWLVEEGAEVAEDQPLLKVETDKAVVELPSPRAGTVLVRHAAADDTIHVGDPLVTLGVPGEEVETPRTAPSAVPRPSGEAEPAPQASATGSVAEFPARRPLATPRTRALARRLGVELSGVRGTGSGGRITDEDVQRAAEGATAPAHADAPSAAPRPAPAPAKRALPPAAPGEREQRIPISHLRKVIASAMRSSKQVSAHVTHVDEADVTELMARYRAVKPEVEAEAGVKLSPLPFFVKALVAALKQHPMLNASVDEEAGEIVVKRYYNIGIAVDTPEGLIVPVVKDADLKDIVTLARELAELAERARSRTLGLHELRGGTCTITNIGPLGGVFATPIINQPELAIVGLHKIAERPAVVAGEIAIRSMMYLSVSFDHRWIDGADAARFMTTLVRLVSEPGRLMVRM